MARIEKLLAIVMLILALVLLGVEVFGQPVWDVAQQGGHQMGDDIAETLQRGLDTQPQHRLPVYIPAGWWKISQTVTTPYNSGCQIVCAGIADPVGTEPRYHWGHPLGGNGTQLVWTGEAGGVMLKATGRWLTIRGGLQLCGRPWVRRGENNAPRAGVGLLITKTGRGLGTGYLQCDELGFEDFAVGIQCGASTGDGNCENNVFSVINFQKCDIGYLGVNTMGMGTSIRQVLSHRTPRTFVFEGGGLLNCDNVNAVSTTLLTVRAARDDPRGGSASGTGNGYFEFGSVKVDSQSGSDFTALDVEVLANVHCVINGGILSNQTFAEQGGTFAKLKGRSALTVRDFRGALGKIEGERQPYGNRGAISNVLLDRCQLWGKPEVVGDVEYREHNCYDGYGYYLDTP